MPAKRERKAPEAEDSPFSQAAIAVLGKYRRRMHAANLAARCMFSFVFFMVYFARIEVTHQKDKARRGKERFCLQFPRSLPGQLEKFLEDDDDVVTSKSFRDDFSRASLKIILVLSMLRDGVFVHDGASDQRQALQALGDKPIDQVSEDDVVELLLRVKLSTEADKSVTALGANTKKSNILDSRLFEVDKSVLKVDSDDEEGEGEGEGEGEDEDEDEGEGEGGGAKAKGKGKGKGGKGGLGKGKGGKAKGKKGLGHGKGGKGKGKDKSEGSKGGAKPTRVISLVVEVERAITSEEVVESVKAALDQKYPNDKPKVKESKCSSVSNKAATGNSYFNDGAGARRLLGPPEKPQRQSVAHAWDSRDFVRQLEAAEPSPPEESSHIRSWHSVVCKEVPRVSSQHLLVDSSGKNALHLACMYGRFTVFNLLKQWGYSLTEPCSSPTATERSGGRGGRKKNSTSPLVYVLSGSDRMEDREKIAELILAETTPEQIEAPCPATGLTALHLAIFHEYSAEVIAIIISKTDTQLLNHQDCNMFTPLMYAALSGNAGAVKMLLKCGANPHVVAFDSDGEQGDEVMATALSLAQKCERNLELKPCTDALELRLAQSSGDI